MDINEFVTHLAKEITPQGVLCYGSYAQMLQDNKSDIDLLVLVNNVQDNLREITYSKFPDTKIVSLGKNMGDWDVSWTPVNDCLMIGDQAIDIGYNTTEWVNRVIENLIIKNQITFDEFPFRPYTFLGLLETCKILYDKNHFIASCDDSDFFSDDEYEELEKSVQSNIALTSKRTKVGNKLSVIFHFISY